MICPRTPGQEEAEQALDCWWFWCFYPTAPPLRDFSHLSALRQVQPRASLWQPMHVMNCRLCSETGRVLGKYHLAKLSTGSLLLSCVLLITWGIIAEKRAGEAVTCWKAFLQDKPFTGSWKIYRVKNQGIMCATFCLGSYFLSNFSIILLTMLNPFHVNVLNTL